MKWKVSAFLLVGLLLGGLLGYLIFWTRSPARSQANRRLPPTVGSIAPVFELPLLDGLTNNPTQKLADLQGWPVVINFWATWCPPCKEEMPLLERYHQKYAGNLVILGVDYEEEPGVIRPFVKELGINFPILLDRSGNVADLYFVRDFPATFFVDEKGILRAQHLGVLSEELLVPYLETIGIKP